MKKLMILVIAAAAALAAKIPAEGYKAGDRAADFRLKNVDGKMLSMAGYKTAKGFIVVFTCNHCPVSQGYEQRIIALDKKYAQKGYPVLAISPSDPASVPADSYENMQKVATAHKYTFPYLIDETQAVSKAFGARATPHAFVIQKTGAGNVVEYVGAIDNNAEDGDPNRTNYVEKAVDALLEGRKPVVNTTKAFGCSITYKN
ncbi:thioredoxin family protein [Hufsiella ginkgonis]|uniref:Redoxin domain-containing protein n=1 Tax=Hufsiella ginkgonis TaxID=2695274 RepID=A0A7K1XWZ0_9SPHI|nr:thioredoxin family protein [Hufsiella ginkgonis]MXV15318.1 redoxin domain-containing protein [Hufsiella ginkgonis]